MERALGAVLIALIQAYRVGVAPVFPSTCRFRPSCSEYGVEAIREHGPVAGMLLTVRRISRCHPLYPAGIDLVPQRRSR